MRNILSYSPFTTFKGKEIKEWIRFHIENKTEYTKEAKNMADYLDTLSDDREYEIGIGDYQATGRQFCIYKL